MKFKDFQHLLREARFQTLADTRYEGDLQRFRFTIDPNIYGSDWGTVISTAVYCPTQRPDLCISLLDITIALLTGKCEHADGSGFELVAGYIPNSGPDIPQSKALNTIEIGTLLISHGYEFKGNDTFYKRLGCCEHSAVTAALGSVQLFCYDTSQRDPHAEGYYSTGYLCDLSRDTLTTLLTVFSNTYN